MMMTMRASVRTRLVVAAAVAAVAVLLLGGCVWAGASADDAREGGASTPTVAPGAGDSSVADDEFGDVHQAEHVGGETHASSKTSHTPEDGDAAATSTTDEGPSEGDTSPGSGKLKAALMNSASAKAARLVFHQIAIVLIPIYVITAINKYYPLPGFIFGGLQRFVPPPAQDLIKFSKQTKIERDVQGEIQDFAIPRSSQVRPQKRQITAKELWSLQFIASVSDLLIVAASVLAALVGFIGWALVTKNSLNFNSAAFFLAALGVLECMKILFTLGLAGGRYEIGVNLACAFVWLFVSLVLWLTAADFVAIDGAQVYSQMQASALQFLEESNLDTKRLVFPEYRSLKPLIALVGGAIAGLLTFPSFRFARAYASASVVHRENTAKMVLLHASFVAPLFVTLLFASPTANAAANALQSQLPSKLQPHALLLLRLLGACCAVALRWAVLPTLMQAYLDLAQERLAQLDTVAKDAPSPSAGESQAKKKQSSKKKKKAKKEQQNNTKKSSSAANSGDDDTISAGLVQRMVANIWDFAGVACLQLITPPLLVLFGTAIMGTRSTIGAEDPSAPSVWGELGALLVWWVSLATTTLNFAGFALLRVSGAVPTLR